MTETLLCKALSVSAATSEYVFLRGTFDDGFPDRKVIEVVHQGCRADCEQRDGGDPDGGRPGEDNSRPRNAGPSVMARRSPVNWKGVGTRKLCNDVQATTTNSHQRQTDYYEQPQVCGDQQSSAAKQKPMAVSRFFQN